MKKYFSEFLFTFVMFLVGINPFKSNNNAIADNFPGPPKVICPQFLCKSVQVYWTANTQDVTQYEILVPAPGGGGNVWKPTLNAMPEIFAIASPDIDPPGPVLGSVITPFAYNTCIPTCGLDPKGNWQATQEVFLGNQAVKGKAYAKTFQSTCSPNNRGLINIVIPPDNTNTSKPPQDPLPPPPG